MNGGYWAQRTPAAADRALADRRPPPFDPLLPLSFALATAAMQRKQPFRRGP